MNFIRKQAFYSHNIFPSESSNRIDGFLLLEEDKIKEIRPITTTSYLPTLISLQEENYEIFDYSEFYICPGIIDPHVNLNSNYDEFWQEIENITKMAASGGVTTIIDHPCLIQYDSTHNESLALKERIDGLNSKLYVDCGILANLSGNSIKSIKELMKNDYILGFKYFFQPGLLGEENEDQVQFNDILRELILEKINTVLFIMCEKANKKDLFPTSPCRSMPLSNRLDLNHDISNINNVFAGGFSYSIGQEESPISSNQSDSDSSEALEKIDEIKEETTPEKKIKKKKSYEKKSKKINFTAETSKDELIQKENIILLEKTKELKLIPKNLIFLEKKPSLERATEQCKLIPENSLKEIKFSEKTPKNLVSKKSNFANFSYTEINSSELKKLSNEIDEKKTFENLRNAELSGYQHEDLSCIKECFEDDHFLLFSTDEELKETEETNSFLEEDIDIESKQQSARDSSMMSLENNPTNSEIVLKNKPFLVNLKLLPQNKLLKSPKICEIHCESENFSVKSNDFTDSPNLKRKRNSLFDRRNVSPLTSPLLPFSLEIQTPKLGDVFKNGQQKNNEFSAYEKEISRKYEFFIANRPANLERIGIRMVFKEYSFLDNIQKISLNIVLSNLSLSSSCALLKDQRKIDIHMNVFSEVGLPFLSLSDQKIKDGFCHYKSSPPIRDKDNMKLLRVYFMKKAIDMVGSAHLTVPFKYKIIDEGNFRRAFSGLSSIGANLQIIWSILQSGPKNSSKFELDEKIKFMIKVLSGNPAKILKIDKKKGSLEKGKDADFFIWSPFEISAMEKENIGVKNKSLYVFKKHKFYGKIYATYLRGGKIYDINEKGMERSSRGEILKQKN